MTALSQPITIDPTNVSAPAMGELLPKGKYKAKVAGAEEKTSQKGNNYLEVEFILENTRHIWHIFNLWNPSNDSKEISQKEFNKLGAICGVSGQVTDTDQILGREVLLDVGIKAGTAGYPDKNVVKDFLPPTVSASVSTTAQASADVEPTSTRTAAPWAQ